MEEEIATRLRNSMPTGVVPEDPIVEVVPGDRLDTQPTYPLDETTEYKLHGYFGEEYSLRNETNRAQLLYIYEEVSKEVGTKDYGYVIAKIRDLEQIMGTFNGERRMYKLYEWLKLNNVRKSAETQMGALRG